MRAKAGDRIDMTIANRDDPEARRTVYDMYNDRNVVLTERDLEIIRCLILSLFCSALSLFKCHIFCSVYTLQILPFISLKFD